MKTFDVIAAIVLVIGGLNWGLVALSGVDLVSTALGELSGSSRAVYALMGLAAVYQVLTWRAIQKRWALAWARY
jgi:uncharacterized membrane protein YuzA (DUF378 family)